MRPRRPPVPKPRPAAPGRRLSATEGHTWPETAGVRGLYLLHFDPSYEHAGHYLGFAEDIARRLGEHAAGNGKSSPLVRAAMGAGCEVTLAATWPRQGRKTERRLKDAGGLSRYCPTCRATGTYHR